jgi:hypothetical protein
MSFCTPKQVLVFLVFILSLCVIFPGSSLAKKDYVAGSGMSEGDPGDGDETMGGGGGSTLIESSYPHMPALPILQGFKLMISSFSPDGFSVLLIPLTLDTHDLNSSDILVIPPVGGER